MMSRLLRQTGTGERMYKFLLDLCLGTARAMATPDSEAEFDDENTDQMLAQDLTFRAALARPNKSLIIEEQVGDVTPTLKGLNSIDVYMRERSFVNSKDVLAAYQTLLRDRSKVA
ncbi:TPA: hypothetical protein L6A02_24740 [Pseudomonas aeruginosa]|nr:hypothetical protein [Pseudomonas aeruginosa]